MSVGFGSITNHPRGQWFIRSCVLSWAFWSGPSSLLSSVWLLACGGWVLWEAVNYGVFSVPCWAYCPQWAAPGSATGHTENGRSVQSLRSGPAPPLSMFSWPLWDPRQAIVRGGEKDSDTLWEDLQSHLLKGRRTGRGNVVAVYCLWGSGSRVVASRLGSLDLCPVVHASQKQRPQGCLSFPRLGGLRQSSEKGMQCVQEQVVL